MRTARGFAVRLDVPGRDRDQFAIDITMRDVGELTVGVPAWCSFLHGLRPRPRQWARTIGARRAVFFDPKARAISRTPAAVRADEGENIARGKGRRATFLTGFKTP